MGRVASFHLIRELPGRAPFAMARLGLDRPIMSRIDGLRFWRLMGTGNGSNTSHGADPRRTALFAVWDTETDLEQFLAAHPMARRWKEAEEHWTVRLRLLGGHGTWRGVDPLEGMVEGDRSGKVAIITRADVRRRSWRDFGAAGREVDVELHTAPGLIDVVGIGEAPVGRLATFSLWESMNAARTYAYSMPRHQQVIEETRAGDWYSEEMFARFEPYQSIGTWDGRDPLAS